ncbi:MAG: hypothetical protein FJ285_05310 [Planctomycetes bacterium]|nr:hypothetical protein [Planctomycetota bacterium]
MAAGLLAVVGLAIIWLLPAENRQGRIEVTLTFPGASDGKLPNGTPFNFLEISSAPVVEPIWRSQGLETAIPIADLLRSLTAMRGGREARALSELYQSKLSNPKLTVLERDAIEKEWRAGIAALNGSTVLLTLADSKNRLSDEQITQFLSVLPKVWATWSDALGARTYDYPLPSGAELRASESQLSVEAGTTVLAGAVVRHFERLKDFNDTLAVTLASLSKLPGSDAVRDGRGASLTDLVQEVRAMSRNMVIPAYIEALAIAKRKDPRGYQALRAARMQLQESQYDVAKERALVLKQVFDDFMEVTNSGTRRTPFSDGQNKEQQAGLIANVDGTFIDRVIDQAVSSRDVSYRRELTEKRLQAELAVVELVSALEFENWLDKSVNEQTDADVVSGSSSQEIKLLTEQTAELGNRTAVVMGLLAQRNFNSAAAAYRLDEEAVVFSTPFMSTKTALTAGLGLWVLTMLLVGVLALRSSGLVEELNGFSSDRLKGSPGPSSQQASVDKVTTQGTSTGLRARSSGREPISL